MPKSLIIFANFCLAVIWVYVPIFYYVYKSKAKVRIKLPKACNFIILCFFGTCISNCVMRVVLLYASVPDLRFIHSIISITVSILTFLIIPIAFNALSNSAEKVDKAISHLEHGAETKLFAAAREDIIAAMKVLNSLKDETQDVSERLADVRGKMLNGSTR